MSSDNVSSSLRENPYIRIVENNIICDGPGRRHRGFPTGVRLPNGDILVGFRVGTDHHMTLDGAFCITRSSDNGKTWTPPKALAARPGWDICGSMGQYPDGVLSSDEPFLWSRLQCYRWLAKPGPAEDYRIYQTYWSLSYDYGDNWEAPFPLCDTSVSTVMTDRGEMTFSALSPHSYSSTLIRLSDGTVMGMFSGNTNLMKYRAQSKAQSTPGTKMPVVEIPLAGFSNDNMRTWSYVIVADSKEYGIGFSEADIARLGSGRIVAIYGNNRNSRFFFQTSSDDEGRTWSPMEQLGFRGDSPSLITLSTGVLLAAIRSIPEEGEGRMGIGLVVSSDGGENWDLLGNIHDQGDWDMGYPDLIRLATGRILCVYYTGNEKLPISKELERKLSSKEPMRTIFGGVPGAMRPAAFGEIQSEIRCAILEEVDSSQMTHCTQEEKLGNAAKSQPTANNWGKAEL